LQPAGKIDARNSKASSSIEAAHPLVIQITSSFVTEGT